MFELITLSYLLSFLRIGLLVDSNFKVEVMREGRDYALIFFVDGYIEVTFFNTRISARACRVECLDMIMEAILGMSHIFHADFTAHDPDDKIILVHFVRKD